MKKLSVIVLVMLALASCESRSGQMARERAQNAYKATNPATNAGLEKVVIIKIDGIVATLDGGSVSYKVRRVEKGVVAFIRLYNQSSYAVGDTIYFKF